MAEYLSDNLETGFEILRFWQRWWSFPTLPLLEHRWGEDFRARSSMLIPILLGIGTLSFWWCQRYATPAQILDRSQNRFGVRKSCASFPCWRQQWRWCWMRNPWRWWKPGCVQLCPYNIVSRVVSKMGEYLYMMYMTSPQVWSIWI